MNPSAGSINRYNELHFTILAIDMSWQAVIVSSSPYSLLPPLGSNVLGHQRLACSVLPASPLDRGAQNDRGARKAACAGRRDEGGQKPTRAPARAGGNDELFESRSP